MRKVGLFFASALALSIVIGCATSQPVVVKTGTDTTPQTDQSGQPAQPAQSDAPPATSVSAQQLAIYKTSYDQAKAAYAKKSSDPATKQAYIDATVKYATGTMMADSLEPKVKYPGALRLYREALKADPNNKEAANNRDLIEGIYKQMGRPIPN